MTAKKTQSYISSTLKFCIAGLLIPMLTVYVIVGLQMGIELLGIECKTSWTVLWTITSIGIVIAPFIFIRLMNKKLATGYNYSNDKLLNFNIVEYTCIQCILATLFTNRQTLCYGNGGQNGMEFMFTGWLALPFLIIFSLVFDNLRNRKINELKATKIPD